MKKSMTAEEFKLYWKREDFVRILYLSENQEWYWTEEPCKMTMVFQEIEILENQNKIFLKSDGSTLVFSMVKEIKIDTGCQGLDTAISIRCGAEQEEKERVYTLVAQKADRSYISFGQRRWDCHSSWEPRAHSQRQTIRAEKY